LPANSRKQGNSVPVPVLAPSSAAFAEAGNYPQGDFDSGVATITVKDESGLADIKAALSAAAEQGGRVALKVFGDNAHKCPPAVIGVNLMTDGAHYYVHTEGNNALLQGTVSALAGAGLPLIGHSLQSDLYMLFATLKYEKGGNAYRDLDSKVAFDSAIAQYLLDPGASNYSIKRLALEYFGRDVEDEDEFYKNGTQMDMLDDGAERWAEYGRRWCLCVRSLTDALAPRIEEEGLKEVMERAELPLIAPLAALETEGFDFDKEALTDVGSQISEGIEKLTREIHEITGEEFNINSPQQLGVVLFEKLGLPGGKKTKTGYATGAEILEKIAGKSPVIAKVLEYRTLTKLRGTYIDGLIPLVATDGRIHAHFQQTVTATGRISCTEPNLQNIPIRQEFGRQIRKAFVPGLPAAGADGDYILLGADYSQIELRILAHFSRDESLIEDFRQGADIHKRTAARVFGVAENDVTMQQRSGAKAVNFGVIYGMSSFGLSEGLGITRKEAESYINEYFARHRAVKTYLDECISSAKNSGYAVTILGRRRAIPELKASNYMVRGLGERLAMNTPIQGSAADIIKLAMIDVDRELRARRLASTLILQVHDELIIRAPKSEATEAAGIMKEKMESAIKLEVPLVVEVNRGASWYDLK
jgi:DNA polymerase-1